MANKIHISVRSAVRYFTIAGGVFCLLLAALMTISTFDTLRTYERATGVIELHESRQAGQAVMRPSVTYMRLDDERTFGHSPKLGELPSGYVAGGKVTVLYKPKGKDSLIATPWMWATSALVGFAGVLLITVGGFVLRKANAEAKHSLSNLKTCSAGVGSHSF